MKRKRLQENLARQRAFLDGGQPGQLLIFTPKPQPCSLMTRCNQLIRDEGFPGKNEVRSLVGKYLQDFRRWQEHCYPDDQVPIVPVHFDIGVQTAAMTNLEPRFHGGHWWLEPNLSWEAIEQLSITMDSPWIQLLLDINQALWAHWNQDFFFLPFLHRSPLDAANGIRGTALFTDMYDRPEQVKALVQWCVRCQLAIEDHIHYYAPSPEPGWGNGHMGVWLPQRAVWVNGDPVTMISARMMREFEQPYTGELFSRTGGGFFHNHTKGLFQVAEVAQTPGIILQQFTRDPNCPTVQETLLSDPEMRSVILEASLQTPVYISGMRPEELHAVLPLLQEGRFILEVDCGGHGELALDTIERVRSVRGLG